MRSAAVPEAPGSSRFWADFLRRSRGLRVPVHRRGLFHPPLCTFDDVAEVLRAMGRASDKVTFGIFVDDVRSPKHHARLRARPPAAGESLEAWSRRVFGNKTFGLLINGAEQVSDRLARAVAAFLAPLLLERGMPWGGVDISFFIGNYAHTPFGIHQDVGVHVLHAHLGPGTKELLLWSLRGYRRHNGSWDESFDVARLRPHARRFLLRPGDFFYLPPTYFHVGATPELSAAMMVVLIERSEQEFLKQALTEALAREQPALWPEGGDVDTVVSDLSSLDRRLGSWIDESVSDLELSLASNQGLRRAPGSAAVLDEPWEGTTLRRVQPFRILYRRQGRQLVYFLRRRRFVAAFTPRLTRLFDRLNAGRDVGTREALSAFAPGLESKQGPRVITTWLASRAMEVVG